MTTMDPRPAPDASHPSNRLALLIGVVYVLLGVAGLGVAGRGAFAGPDGQSLLVFDVNGLLGLIHLATGVAGIVMSRRLDTAVLFGWAVLVVYGLLGIYGLVVAGDDGPANIFGVNQPTNALHHITAVTGLLTAGWSKAMARTRPAGPRHFTENGQGSSERPSETSGESHEEGTAT